MRRETGTTDGPRRDVVLPGRSLLAKFLLGLAISGLVLRYGLGAESLAWVGVFIIAPVSGIYYPVETLPGWLQPVSTTMPCTTNP